MAKRVIVNADDFGLSNGSNTAVAALLDDGRINSTTVMSNGPAFEEAVELHAARKRQWNVGLHVNLTQFGALSEAAIGSSLTDKDGQFLGRRNLLKLWLTGRLDKRAIASEVGAQLERARSGGFEISHMDSHQHAHSIPSVFAVACELAKQERLPVRWIYPDREARSSSLRRAWQSAMLRVLAGRARDRVAPECIRNDSLLSIFSAGGLPSVDAYRKMLAQSRAECVELMVHPACPDPEHRKATRIADVSEADWEVLSSPEWRALLDSGEFHFISYPEVT